MKSFKSFTILLIIATISFTACRIDPKKPSTKTATPNTTTSNPAALLEPAQNASGIWHYTCIKQCAGGAGAAGNCSTCGSPLVHNAVYHGNSTQTVPTSPSNAPFATPSTAAQNTAGVWHYSCKRGCSGGSGTAGDCSTCGEALAHNKAYH